MKKILSILIIATLLFSICSVASAEETAETSATYSFGDAETITDSDGSVVKKIPIKLTVADSNGVFVPVYNVTTQIRFDNTSLEYIPYASASDKGDQSGLYIGGVTDSDSSVVGIGYMVSNGRTVTFDNNIVCYLRFKVKSTASEGNKTLVITNCDISYKDTSIESERENVKSINECNYSNGLIEILAEEIPETPEEPENPGDDGEEEELPGDDDEEDSVPSKPSGPSVIAPVEVKVEFTDLTGYEWAEEYIVDLAKKGIIKGVSEKEFAPGNKITRADFMVLLMRLLKIDGKSTETFTDVDGSQYYAEAVLKAKELGIANGDQNGNFNPTNTISRQDLCTLVYRALDKTGYLPELPEGATGFDAQYSDVSLISSYAYDAMKTLSELKILNGSNGLINPTGNATRAETAAIIYRVSKLIESK